MSKQKSNILISFFDMLKRSKKTVLLMVIVAAVSIAGTSLVSIMLNRTQNVYLPSLGVIKTIEVETYADAAGNNRIEQLEWDELSPGDTVVNEFYVKSISNFEIELTIKLMDWTPPDITEYITLTWDYNGERLSSGEIIPITMNVTAVDSDEFVEYLVENKVQQFSVDIHFIGVE